MVAVERGSNKLMLENKGKVFNLQPSIIFHSNDAPEALVGDVLAAKARQGQQEVQDQ